MYEDIVFKKGFNLKAIPNYSYSEKEFTSIGKFDFKGIKGNILGKALSAYINIELYAPKEWFKETPDFGYRVEEDGVGPFRLEDNNEYYKLPSAGLYNEAFQSVDSEESIKEIVYESMVNVFKEHIPQIFEEKLKIAPQEQKNKLTVYAITDYAEILSGDGADVHDYCSPVKTFVDRDEAEKEFKEVFDACKESGVRVFSDDEFKEITFDEALQEKQFFYFVPGDFQYGFCKLSNFDLALSKEQLEKNEATVYLVEDIHLLPGDSKAKIFADKEEAVKEYQSLVSSLSYEASSRTVNPSGTEFVWNGSEDCRNIVIRKEILRNKNISKLKDLLQTDEKLQYKVLLMADLRQNKPVDVIKKPRLKYEDISSLGSYYYNLAELKKNPLVPIYDNDREIIKEMIQDGLTDARVLTVFKNIDDRRHIKHQPHIAHILKEPTIKQYKAMFRQKTRTMQKQR